MFLFLSLFLSLSVFDRPFCVYFCMFPVCPLCCFIVIPMDLVSEINDDDDDDDDNKKQTNFHLICTFKRQNAFSFRFLVLLIPCDAWWAPPPDRRYKPALRDHHVSPRAPLLWALASPAMGHWSTWPPSPNFQRFFSSLWNCTKSESDFQCSFFSVHRQQLLFSSVAVTWTWLLFSVLFCVIFLCDKLCPFSSVHPVTPNPGDATVYEEVYANTNMYAYYAYSYKYRCCLLNWNAFNSHQLSACSIYRPTGLHCNRGKTCLLM